MISGRVGKVSFANALGAFDDVVQESSELLPWAEAHDDAFLRVVLLCALGSVDIARGTTYADPLEIADAARGIGAPFHADPGRRSRLGPRDEELARSLLKEALVEPSAGAWLYEATEVAVRVGEEDLVRDAVEEGPTATPLQRAGKAFALGMLHEADGEFEQAGGEFESAADGLARLGVRPGQGTALMGLGRCLVQLGRAEEAVSYLEEARQLWVEMGAMAKIADVDRMLATTG